MSKAQSKSDDDSDDYPFMVEEIDGELTTLALFIPSNKQFYEPLPRGHPDVDHDTALTLQCPRTGELFDYEANWMSRQIQKSYGNHCIGKVSAERWAEFRETYVDADETDVERANEWLDEHVFEYDK